MVCNSNWKGYLLVGWHESVNVRNLLMWDTERENNKVQEMCISECEKELPVWERERQKGEQNVGTNETMRERERERDRGNILQQKHPSQCVKSSLTKFPDKIGNEMEGEIRRMKNQTELLCCKNKRKRKLIPFYNTVRCNNDTTPNLEDLNQLKRELWGI